MVLYIPTIYFTTLIIYIVKKRGFDISACILSVFDISAICSIILKDADYEYYLVDFKAIELTLTPTLIYCLLISLCVYPFYRYNSNAKWRRLKELRNYGLFRNLIILFVAVFFMIFLVFRERILFGLFASNLNDVRVEALTEGYSATEGLSGFKRIIASPLMILGHVAYFLLPLFFYNVCLHPEKHKYNSLILLASSSPIVLGILNIDRSKVFYWVLLFYFSYIWFRPYIKLESQKKFINRIGFVFLGLFMIYFLAVSISRFGERDGGLEGGLIIYAGQPYLNFCNLWDHYQNPITNWAHILPISNYLGGNLGMKDWYAIAYAKSGMKINIFYSFLGMFLVDIGHIAVFVGAFALFLICYWIVSVQRRKNLSISTIIYIFSIAIILQCGVINYFYAGLDRAIGLIFFILVGWFFSRVKN